MSIATLTPVSGSFSIFGTAISPSTDQDLGGAWNGSGFTWAASPLAGQSITGSSGTFSATYSRQRLSLGTTAGASWLGGHVFGRITAASVSIVYTSSSGRGDFPKFGTVPEPSASGTYNASVTTWNGLVGYIDEVVSPGFGVQFGPNAGAFVVPYNLSFTVSSVVYTVTYDPITITSTSGGAPIQSPAHGPLAGGTVFTITGTNFGADLESSFTIASTDSAPATFVNSTTMTATSPPFGLAGLQDLWLTDYIFPNGFLYDAAAPSFWYFDATTNDYVYTPTNPGPPWVRSTPTLSITSIGRPQGLMGPEQNPPTGPAGVRLIVTGTGFGIGLTATVGGVAATVVVVNSNRLLIFPGAHANGLADVVITNPDALNYTAPNGYTYVSPATGLPIVVPNPVDEASNSWGLQRFDIKHRTEETS